MVGEPLDRPRRVAAGHDIEEPSGTDIDDPGQPFLGPKRAPSDRECFVDPDRVGCADPVDVSVKERLSPGGHGGVDGVPVSAELTGYLRHGATVLADLDTCPHAGPAGETLTWRRYGVVDLGPRPCTARHLGAPPPAFAPTQPGWPAKT